jgi:hypothetical protein
MPKVSAIRAVLDSIEYKRPVHHQTLRAARAELIVIVDSPEVDARKLRTYEMAQEIYRLRDLGMCVADICDKLDITRRQYERYREKHPRSRTPLLLGDKAGA